MFEKYLLCAKREHKSLYCYLMVIYWLVLYR